MVENALVEEHQGIHRLILGRRGDVAAHGQICQERLNFRLGRKEVRARAHAVKPDEPYNPIQVRAFRMNGIMMETEHITGFIKELWLLTSRRVRHTRAPFWRFE